MKLTTNDERQVMSKSIFGRWTAQPEISSKAGYPYYIFILVDSISDYKSYKQ